MRPHLRVVIAVWLVFAACSSGSGSHAPASGPANGAITVFAAASLTEAFTDAAAAQADIHVSLNFGASGTLVAQVEQGAPADVIATADNATMQKLTDAGLVDTPTTFASNRLEIIVAPGNPKHVQTLADLARPDLTVVLADPSVPAGKYAAQALQRADVEVSPKSLESDVKAAVARVTNGEADAAIVYATDVQAAGSKAQGIEIPTHENLVAEYPVAIVKGTKNRAAAQAFIDSLLHGSGRDAIRRAGFEVTP